MIIEYLYTHTATQAVTGYFSCEPYPQPALDAALQYLANHPLDDFMRRHLLSRLASLPDDAFTALFASNNNHPIVATLYSEAALLRTGPSHSTEAAMTDIDLAKATPLIYLRAARLPDASLQKQWNAVFEANIKGHRALKNPHDLKIPLLYNHTERVDPTLPGQRSLFSNPSSVHVTTVHARHVSTQSGDEATGKHPPSSAEIAALAEERLSRTGIIAGQEMRHTASLSPVGLLRPWNMRLRVCQGRHDFHLHGQATTYGRGLSVADARASCLMEMVERTSVYVSVADDRVDDRASTTIIHQASLSELRAQGAPCLDPNDFPLEVPYADASILWVSGQQVTGVDSSEGKTGMRYGPCFAPLQMASLFSNLDEISLFEGMGSTGIATGCTMEQAKLAALLEVLERDAEATTPYHKSGCFRLEVGEDDDPLLSRLLADYEAQGIHIQFQDLTGAMGVPVYKCFVMSPKGSIAAGHGAGFSSRRAIVSAITETPFPYPDHGPSGPALRKLPVRRLVNLPDYTLQNTAANLALLEELLFRNNRAPIYVDLTRADLEFPVVRAFIPGMELSADRDIFSRVPLRLYDNYLRVVSV